MLKDKTFWKIHIKWGVIAGLMLIGIEILKMLARKVDYQSAQILDLAMIIGFVLVLYNGVREFKEVYTERLSFAKAFLSCIVISFIGAVTLFGYDLLHYSVIEKDGLQQKYTVALEKYKQNLAKDTLTTVTADSVMLQREGCLTDANEQQALRDEINSQFQPINLIFYLALVLLSLVLAVSVNSVISGHYNKRMYEFGVYRAIGLYGIEINGGSCQDAHPNRMRRAAASHSLQRWQANSGEHQ